MTNLQSCAEDVEVLFKGYDQVDWMIDRMFVFEFLSDQMFDFGDTVSNQFTVASSRDAFRFGYLGYNI